MFGYLLIVVLLSATVHAEVTELTQDMFFTSVMAGADDWLIYLTSEVDPNADGKEDLLESLAPTASKYGIRIAQADCGVRAHKKMCSTLLGASTPTGQPAASSLRLVSGPSSSNPYTKKVQCSL